MSWDAEGEGSTRCCRQVGVEGGVPEDALEEGGVDDGADGLARLGHAHEQVSDEGGRRTLQVLVEEERVGLPGQGLHSGGAHSALQLGSESEDG